MIQRNLANRISQVTIQLWPQAFKDGDIRFLICTDVAARGIDIAGLPFVINMTLPDRSEDYIHRVGRVGELIYIHTLLHLLNYIIVVYWSCLPSRQQ